MKKTMLLSELEALVGLSPRTHSYSPAFDACLGRSCVHGEVVNIEFESPKVKVTFKR